MKIVDASLVTKFLLGIAVTFLICGLVVVTDPKIAAFIGILLVAIVFCWCVFKIINEAMDAAEKLFVVNDDKDDGDEPPGPLSPA